MKKLVCEMCGSTDLIKDNGVFVCQSCGCKYTVEEARKMMIEGTVEVTGTVKVDNSEAIDNYLKMAESALTSSNNEEAENYANKIIELEPQHAQAWFIKGKAAGWQTTGKNNRFPESITAWINAYNYASDTDKDAMAEDIKDEASNIAIAIVTMKANAFATLRNENAINDLFNTVSMIGLQAVLLASKTAIVFNSNEVTTKIARALYKGVNDAYGNALHDRGLNTSEFAVLRFAETLDYCRKILQRAYNMSFDNDLCFEVCNCYKMVADTCLSNLCHYYKHKPGVYGGTDILTNAYSESARNGISQEIKDWEKKSEKHDPKNRKRNRDAALKLINDNDDPAEKELAINMYWEEHASEKAALEKEMNELDDKYSQLQSEWDSSPDRLELEKIKNEISSLRSQRDSMGAFKGKEKKALDERIENLRAEERPCQEKWLAVSRDVKKEMGVIESRKSEIYSELNKDRGKIVKPKQTIELFDGQHGAVNGLELEEYHRAVLPSTYAVKGDGEEAIINCAEEGQTNYYPYKNYKINFESNGRGPVVALEFCSESVESPFESSISYILEGERTPSSVADYASVVKSSLIGICPDIDISSMEEKIVNAAYGFIGDTTFEADDVICTIDNNIKEDLKLKLTHK